MPIETRTLKWEQTRLICQWSDNLPEAGDIETLQQNIELV